MFPFPNLKGGGQIALNIQQMLIASTYSILLYALQIPPANQVSNMYWFACPDQYLHMCAQDAYKAHVRNGLKE